MWIWILIPGLVYLLLQFWMLWAWEKIRPPQESDPGVFPPISVIIAAHNACGFLKKNLQSVLDQDYPVFEVIVALDRCTDRSLELLHQLQKEYPQLIILEIDSVPAQWASKKWVLEQAIKQANHKHLAFTDSDCRVESEWLRNIGLCFFHGAEIVLGIGLYERHPGLLNAFIRFETFYAAFQYIAMAFWHKPYMAVGRNLAYTKSFFEEAGGFENIKGSVSGDDDLLINAYGKRANICPMYAAGSRSISAPKLTLKAWFRQKQRHLSASRMYSAESKIYLGIFHLSLMGFYLALWVSLGVEFTTWTIFSLYTGRLLLSWRMFSRANKKLRFQQLLFLYPVLDLLFFIYNLTVVPIGLLTEKPEWI